MSSLSLRLFGPGTLSHGDDILRPHSAKTLALLAYLAIEAPRPHARTRLANLLWHDQTEAIARRNLRQALYSLNTLAGGRLQPCLHIDSDVVTFVHDRSIDVDVVRFMQGIQAQDDRSWEAAAGLYVAPFLEDRTFDASEQYEAWLIATRENAHALAMQNLDRLTALAISQRRWDRASAHASALSRLDPASESVARHMFRVHAARNDVAAIDDCWRRLREVLRRQFQAMPTPETDALYRRQRTLALAAAAERLASESTPVDESDVSMRTVRAADAESFVRAAQAAERIGGYNQALDLYERALSLISPSDLENLARLGEVLLLKDAVLGRLGRRTEQQTVLEQALDVCARADDPASTAAVLVRLGGVRAYLGQHDEARQAVEEALTIYRTLGDLPGEAEALRELGFVCWHGEDHRAALGHAHEALALHRRLGDVAGEASALHNLAEIHRGLGSPRQAVAWYEEAIRCHWAANHHTGEILSLFGLANALHQLGQAQAAVAKYREALELSERHGERTMQTRALHALSIQYLQRNDLDAAKDYACRTIELDRSIGYAHGLGDDLVDLAHIHALRGERAEALAALQEALAWFDLTHDEQGRRDTHARIDAIDRGSELAALPARRGIKSHLPLGEGKVYCEFESPLARGNGPAAV